MPACSRPFLIQRDTGLVACLFKRSIAPVDVHLFWIGIVNHDQVERNCRR